MRRVTLALAASLAMGGAAHGGSNEVRYGLAPPWVGPPPTASPTTSPEGAPSRVVYFDSQVRLGEKQDETYSAYRLKILTPEALSAGNIAATWNPATEDITVHTLRIIRAGQVTDVLAGSKFQVVRREGALEQAMLDGALTASLHVPGLQVGDEIEFAATIIRRDPVFRGKWGAALQLAEMGGPGSYRARILWPKGQAVQWRATPDLGQATVRAQGDVNEVSQELRDPGSIVLTDGAPPRFNVRRLIQFSEFASWAEVSQANWPLYEQAASLSATSAVRKEAAKIAAATTDPIARAEAALRLVQEQVRYVYVGLDGGNFIPASADVTWERRFGDCKAKTALLLALLRELGVEAEPVLVNAGQVDLSEILLPTPGAFDHVLVRARIGDRSYWLDGTRQGDRRLAALPFPLGRRALPLRPASADLEVLTPEPPLVPQHSSVLEIDAAAGFAAPAKIKVEQTLRGDGVHQARTTLASLSAPDAERAVKGFFAEQDDWIDPLTAGWRYDEAQGALVLSMTGEAKLDWEGDDQAGRRMDIPHAGMSPPAPLRRPKEQDQAAPWLTEFPMFRRWTTILRLPPASAKWRWAYRAEPMEERLGGVVYYREASLEGGVLRTTMSRRAYTPEISAAEAAAIAERLPQFDNAFSVVFQAPNSQPIAGTPPAEQLLLSASRSLEADQHDEAIKAFDQALRANPKLWVAHLGKAEALRRKGDVAAALKALDSPGAASLDDARLARAALLARTGSEADAAAILEAVADANGKNPDALFAVAQTAAYAGMGERAVRIAGIGLTVAPDHIHLLQLRAQQHAKAGHLPEALADLDRAVATQPESLVNFRNRAQILDRMGRSRAALADIDEVLLINPYDEQALNARCWTRAMANVELEQAERDCAEAVRLRPKVGGFWDSYGLVALRRGRFEEALARYDKALALSPSQAISLYARGVVKTRLGDRAGGASDIARAESLNPQADDELAAAGVSP